MTLVWPAITVVGFSDVEMLEGRGVLVGILGFASQRSLNEK